MERVLCSHSRTVMRVPGDLSEISDTGKLHGKGSKPDPYNVTRVFDALD